MTEAEEQDQGLRSKARTLKAGVAGLGIAGTNAVRRLAKHPNVDLVAAADVRPQALEAFRAEYGGRTFENVEVAIRGGDRPEQIVVVGGHYDSVEGSPGADDNASGTAAVLELARLLRGEQFGRTVRFVAFVNEEPPFFSTEWMGSWQYAARAAEQDDNIVAMISLETVGFYQEGQGSQGYPPPFNLFYPDVGNFIGFVGNLPSRALVRRSIATFRRTTQFPSEGVAAPEQIPGVWWSDHAPFWIHGFKAIMITDTAPFRNPHYHQSSDTPDRLNYEKMARVVTGVAEVVRDLANN